MLESRIRNEVMVGGAAGLTFMLALAVAAGILPHAGSDSSGSTQLTAASAAPTVPVAAPEAPPATEAPAPAPVPDAPAPAVHHSAVTTAAPQASEEAAPEESAAPASSAAAPTGVARVTPSSAQVQAAIAGFHQRIPFFTPTAAQVADFGNQVCSAFDQGQTYPQVKATGLQMVSQYPVNISSVDADWMIHTAVSLYCPGYAGKLG